MVDVGASNQGTNEHRLPRQQPRRHQDVVVRPPAGSGNKGIAMIGAGLDLPASGRPHHRLLPRAAPRPVAVRSHRGDSATHRAADSRHRQRPERPERSRPRQSSHNTVPAIRNGVETSRDSAVTLLDSRLIGGAPGAFAMENEGTAHLRRVTTAGYGTAVRDRGVPRGLSPTESWSAPGAIRRHGSTGSPLGLPIAQFSGSSQLRV